MAKYLSFRMRAAGYRGPEVFTPRAVRRIGRARLDGLTRRINILADKALLAAFTENTHAITDRHVRAAVADSEFAAQRAVLAAAGILAAAALRCGVAVGAGIPWLRSPPEPSPSPSRARRPVARRPAKRGPGTGTRTALREDPPEPAKPAPAGG